MNLPVSLTNSLTNLKGYDQVAFEHVHASGEQITSVRKNPLKPTNLFTGAQKVPWSTNGFYLSERPFFTFDPLFHAGAYYVQEASSMFLEQALAQTANLSTSLLVLDLCAAPGGKSTLLQSILSQQSLLVSNEVIHSRVNILKENLTKWGSGNVVVTNNDPKDFSKLKGLFDVVVIDAPCSGSGLFRRDAEAIQEWSIDNVQLCSQRQQRILADVWDCLKEDGMLIYSTCSYSAAEDEEILDWLMQNFQLATKQIQFEKTWGIEEVESTTASAYGYRFWPHQVKGEGFFIAAFQKKEPTDAVRIKLKSAPVPTKTDIAIASKWLKTTAGLSFVLQGQNIAVVPAQWNETIQYLMQELKVRYAGVEMGTIAKNDLIPEHALALSTLLLESINSVELDQAHALNYLRKNEIILEQQQKGWALARYQGMNLGWMKLLGNRINNYYPKEFRILKQG